jgi:fimbrial chaperone protein
MTLVPTQEVTCFPSLFEIGPGESRSIRVGVPLSGGDMERAFRVLIQELPASDPLKGLKVITRLSVPVFVAPVTAQPATIALEGVSQQEGRVSLRVRNSSNLHLLAQSATLRGRDEAGALLFERVMPAWYILAGEARTFDTEVPPEAARAVALEVQLETDRGAVGTSAVLKSP